MASGPNANVWVGPRRRLGPKMSSRPNANAWISPRCRLPRTVKVKPRMCLLWPVSTRRVFRFAVVVTASTATTLICTRHEACCASPTSRLDGRERRRANLFDPAGGSVSCPEPLQCPVIKHPLMPFLVVPKPACPQSTLPCPKHSSMLAGESSMRPRPSCPRLHIYAVKLTAGRG